MNTIEVVAAIIHQNNKILATQRGYSVYKGWWEFPGGKMEREKRRNRLSSVKYAKNWMWK